jgi:hypothetical protein
MDNVIKLQPKVTTTEYFGGCPECGKSSGYLNVGRDHYGTCDEHGVWWPIGANLFSCWRDETEEIWDRTRELLRSRRQVNPIHADPPPAAEPCTRCGSVTSAHGIFCRYSDGTLTPISDKTAREMARNEREHDDRILSGLGF